MASKGAQQTVYRTLAIQLGVTLIAAAGSLVIADFKAAYSALIGGGINLLGTAYFALRVFSVKPGSTAKQMARAFYRGEVVKLLLTGLLFAGVFLWLEVSFLPLFLAYSATMLAFWLVLPFSL